MGGEREFRSQQTHAQTHTYDAGQRWDSGAPMRSEPELAGARELASVRFYLRIVQSALSAVKERATPLHLSQLRMAVGRAGQALERAAGVTDRMAVGELATYQVVKAEYQLAQQQLAAQTANAENVCEAAPNSAEGGEFAEIAAAEGGVCKSAAAEVTPRAATAMTTARAEWAAPVPQRVTAIDWLMTRVERASDGRDDAAAADAVVLAIEALPVQQQQELAQRVNTYRPGSGDELAGRIQRLSLETRRNIQRAFSGKHLLATRVLEATGANPRPPRNKAVEPHDYIAHWEPRLMHELAGAAVSEGWQAPNAHVRWTAVPRRLGRDRWIRGWSRSYRKTANRGDRFVVAGATVSQSACRLRGKPGAARSGRARGACNAVARYGVGKRRRTNGTVGGRNPTPA